VITKLLAPGDLHAEGPRIADRNGELVDYMKEMQVSWAYWPPVVRDA
jgi:hypothetical protein